MTCSGTPSATPFAPPSCKLLLCDPEGSWLGMWPRGSAAWESMSSSENWGNLVSFPICEGEITVPTFLALVRVECDGVYARKAPSKLPVLILAPSLPPRVSLRPVLCPGQAPRPPEPPGPHRRRVCPGTRAPGAREGSLAPLNAP